MSRWLVAATVIWLSGMLWLAHPRRVGDASEYVAMAGQLADGRGAALSPADMEALTRSWAATDTGFELQTRRLPELRGADGRWDMPHMWLYPLLSVPYVRMARLAGVTDAWGLVGLNATLVAGLLWLAAHRGAGPWALSLFVSPIVWWLDKPLADLLLGVLLGAATLLWPRYGPVSLVLLGIGAAQNPALLAGCVVFGLCAVAQDRSRLTDRPWQLAALLGAACAAVAPVYYLVRLDRLSPLTSYAAAAWPTPTTLLFPLTDVNMGVLIRCPPIALVVMVAVLQRRGWREAAALPAALTAAALLLVISQQPNMNQGGNPDLSRYVVWLLPLALPWLLALDRSPQTYARLSGGLMLAVVAVWTAVAFPPSRPESYRYPTPLASWLWSRHPTWTTPRLEAFAERTSHREPAVVPTATPGCEKVLLHAGEWPAWCPPVADAPPACRVTDSYCYADAAGDGRYVFTVAARQALPDAVVHDRTWTRADAVSAWAARQVAGATSGEGAASAARIRGVWGIGWQQAWTRPDGEFLLYAHDAGRGARLALRHGRPVRIAVLTPTGPAEAWRAVPGATPTMVALPAGPHVIVAIGNDKGRP